MTDDMTDAPESLHHRAEPEADPRRARLSHLQRVAIVIALVLVAPVGLLAGARMSPGDVKASIEQRLFGDPEPDWEQAHLVAGDSMAIAGVNVSLMPTDRGQGECIAIETNWQGNTADGSSGETGQRVRCWFEGPAVGWSDPAFRLVTPSDRFGVLTEVPIGPIGDPNSLVALVGAVFPDVVSITVDFGDGAQYTFNVFSADGWFAAILPDRVSDIDQLDGTLVNKVVSMKLIDVEGRVLATITPTPVDRVDYR